MSKSLKREVNCLEKNTKDMAQRLAQLKVEIERERAERERQVVAGRLWRTSAGIRTSRTDGRQRVSISQKLAVDASYSPTVSTGVNGRRNDQQGPSPTNLSHNSVNKKDTLSSSKTSKNSFLSGEYDEEASRRDFQDAVNTWRQTSRSLTCGRKTDATVSMASQSSNLSTVEGKNMTLFETWALHKWTQEASNEASKMCSSKVNDVISHKFGSKKGEANGSGECESRPPALASLRTATESTERVANAPMKGCTTCENCLESQVGTKIISVETIGLSEQCSTAGYRFPDAIIIPE